MELNKIIQGDSLEVLKTFESESVDCIITSPPYWGLRDYGVEGQLGLEKTPEEYVAKMVEVFREVKRVLKKEGVMFLNLGDSYVSGKSRYSSSPQTISGKSRNEPENNNKPDLYYHPYLKDKDLCGIPWRVAFALQADGWYLRQDIIWAKPNPMPESVTDRCTKSHEYIFLLTKSPKYFFDNVAIKEKAVNNPDRERFVYNSNHKRDYKTKFKDTKMGGAGTSFQGHSGYKKADGTIISGEFRNKRSVWTITTKPYAEAHFATFPPDLIIPMIKAGCPVDGVVLDPFMGSGTTAYVARSLGRNYLGIELNPEYIKLAQDRLSQKVLF